MQWIYVLQIKLLALFYPAKLFEKINQLSWYKESLQRWIKEQNIPQNSSILEVGSATGSLSKHLANSYNLTAVDASKSMVKYAKNHANHIDFKVADVYALPFPRGHFDAVLSSSLLNVVSDKKKALLEMKRVCKHTGKVTFLIPVEGFKDTDLTHLIHTFQLTGFSKAALKAWHTMAKKIPIQNIKDLADECGLRITKQQTYLEGMVVSISIS